MKNVQGLKCLKKEKASIVDYFESIERGQVARIEIPEREFIRDERFILETYIPAEIGIGNLFFRDKQKKELGLVFARLLDMAKDKSKRKAVHHAYVHGNTGTGKTILTKFYIRLAQKAIQLEKIKNLKICYVDCRDKNSNWEVSKEIVNLLYDDNKGGLSLADYIKLIIDYAKKLKNYILVVLDEIEKPLKNDGHDALLFQLSNENEKWGFEGEDCRIIILAITNDPSIYSRLAKDTQRRLGKKEIVFEPYKTPEIKGILNQRCEYAYYPNKVDYTLAIQMISALVARDTGDVRHAIELLYHTTMIAMDDYLSLPEMKRHSKLEIKEDHVRRAQKKYEEQQWSNFVKQLPPHQKILFYTLILLAGIADSLLRVRLIYAMYEICCKEIKMEALSDRSIYTKLENLQNKMIVERTQTKGRSASLYILTIGSQAKDVIYNLKLDYPFDTLFSTDTRKKLVKIFFQKYENQKMCDFYGIPNKLYEDFLK